MRAKKGQNYRESCHCEDRSKPAPAKAGEAISNLVAISLQLDTDCFFIFALSFYPLIFELCLNGQIPLYGGVEPPFLKGDLEGFLYAAY